MKDNGGLEYLTPTFLSDSDNPAVRASSKQITADSQSGKDAAIRIFYFVRDGIRFGSSDLYGRASHTLRVGVGDCGLKANVQMTLLRAAGIPARLHATLTRAPVVIDAVFPGWAVTVLPELMGHVWCECCLSGRWIGCDSTFDAPLFEAFVKKGLIREDAIPSIDWNGESDLTPIAPWVTQDLGVCASWEEALESFGTVKGKGGLPPRLVVKLFWWMVDPVMNWRLDRIRDMSAKPWVRSRRHPDRLPC